VYGRRPNPQQVLWVTEVVIDEGNVAGSACVYLMTTVETFLCPPGGGAVHRWPHPLRASILLIAATLAMATLLTGCANRAAHAATPARPGGSSSGAATTSSGTHPVAARRTVIRDFHPGDGPVRQGTGARPGSCWTGSVAAPVAGAYRCLAGNDILDPCFAAGRSDARCYASPWSTAVVLRLTKPLPHLGRPSVKPRYWALQLAGGAQCVALTGTVAVVHGHPLAYSCAAGHYAGLRATRSGPMRVYYGRATGTLTSVAVAVAWRG
jgi:hypothetical protein